MTITIIIRKYLQASQKTNTYMKKKKRLHYKTIFKRTQNKLTLTYPLWTFNKPLPGLNLTEF